MRSLTIRFPMTSSVFMAFLISPMVARVASALRALLWVS